jgi:hypothetical protein
MNLRENPNPFDLVTDIKSPAIMFTTANMLKYLPAHLNTPFVWLYSRFWA